MKRYKPFLLLIALLLSSLYLLERLYYRDSVDFLRPLETAALHIRNDGYGDGHFGAKRKNGRTHKGVDLLAPLGAPVRASKSGWCMPKMDKNGYGRYVKIYHGGGLMTLYAHLEDTGSRWAGKVRQGDVVGRVGKTGNARYDGIKPHLHFEIRVDGKAVDPMQGYLK